MQVVFKTGCSLVYLDHTPSMWTGNVRLDMLRLCGIRLGYSGLYRQVVLLYRIY